MPPELSRPPFRPVAFCRLVDRGDDANQEVEPDAIAVLQADADSFRPDTRDAYMALRIVRELIVHVVRKLAVNADRLELVQHGFA